MDQMEFFELEDKKPGKIKVSRSLAGARDFVEARRDRGCYCPCCDQFVKIYKRRFNAGAARSLIYIWKLTKSGATDEEGYVHIQREFARRYSANANAMDYGQLKWWGLIDPKLSNDENKDTKDTGYWKLTKKGEGVVKNVIRIPARAHILNNTLMGFSEEQTYIAEALGKKFSYTELMAL